jgi:hypothetical protein
VSSSNTHSRSDDPTLSQFVVKHAPRAAIEIAHACARTGEVHYGPLFDAGLAERLAADPDLEQAFLDPLCKDVEMIDAAPIVRSYFERIDVTRKMLLLTGPALKKKAHPANACFYGASFATGGGEGFLRTLSVLIDHGLDLETLSVRNSVELERAASVGHREFVELVVPRLLSVSDEVLRCVVTKSDRPAESISILVDGCRVPISRFLAPRIMQVARADAREYIHARLGREDRIAEAIPESQTAIES